jgi:hypothetical protein
MRRPCLQAKGLQVVACLFPAGSQVSQPKALLSTTRLKFQPGYRAAISDLGSSHPRRPGLRVCAVFGVLLVAASIFPVSVAAKADPKPAGGSVAVCSELCERRDRLRAEIARLHAETALVEAELVLLCTERSNQTDVGLAPLLAVPRSQSPGGTADQATAVHQIAPQTAQLARALWPARRSGKDEIAYAVHCWAPNSTFTDPSCNCLREAAHPKLGSRRTIKILLPSWYGRCSSCRVIPQACFARAPARHVCTKACIRCVQAGCGFGRLFAQDHC